jgi:putative ABC transport system permease protein
LEYILAARCQGVKTQHQVTNNQHLASMIKHYFKIALRNIKRYSTYSILNISGMAIGMACSILILLWVQDEWSFDRHFKNADNLYRVLEKTISIDGHLFQEAKPPTALASALKEQYPEIVRSSKYLTLPISLKKDDEYILEEVAFVDEDFLKMFAIEFKRGDINSAFNGPMSIVLTEEMAHKYFGNDDPIGKTLKASGFTSTVTGVVKSLPHNSHLQFDFLVPFEFLKGMGVNMNNWGAHGDCYSYIELKEGTESKFVDNKIKDIVQSNLKDPVYKPEIFLQNVKKIHLYSSSKFAFDLPGMGDIIYVRILGLVAVFILVIACINFMSLATAQSTRRAKEIGMRKVSGANKTKIILQFLGETLLIVLAAHVIAMILVELFLHGFNNLTGKQLVVDYQNAGLYVGLITVVLICTLLAGSYPALYLSSLKPLNTINGIINKPGKAGFRRVMVVFQFSLSFLLIIFTLIAGNQLKYLQRKNLGLNIDNIGHFTFRYGIHNETLKAELGNNTDILSTTIEAPDVFDADGTAQSFDWDGNKVNGEFYFSALYTDADFAKTFQLELKDGRFFSPDFPGDSTSVVINETATEIIGFKEPIGKILSSSGVKFRIIGVVKDFHIKSLHTKIEPLAIMKMNGMGGNCYIRMKPGHISSTVDYIKKIFKSHNLDYPLQFKFLDDDYDKLYRTEQRIGKILGYSSFLAIIISCMGLIGLSLFMIEIRTKEIGIRKVNGAKPVKIFFLLSKEYLVLVLISILIASPIAWFGINKWLQSYAYRITLNPWIFALVGLIVLFIALLAVGLQSFKAASKNPVDALRYE